MYKNMYFRLFNRITDAIREIESGHTETARNILIQAQLETEQLYIDGADKEKEE